VNDYVTLNSGKVIYAPFEVVGIGPDLRAHVGADQELRTPDAGEWETDRLTAAECVELADQMLARWAAFRERWATPGPAQGNPHA